MRNSETKKEVIQVHVVKAHHHLHHHTIVEIGKLKFFIFPRWSIGQHGKINTSVFLERFESAGLPVSMPAIGDQCALLTSRRTYDDAKSSRGPPKSSGTFKHITQAHSGTFGHIRAHSGTFGEIVNVEP